MTGIEIGRQQGRRQTAVNLNALGLSYDIIQQAAGFLPDEIDQLDITDNSEGTDC